MKATEQRGKKSIPKHCSIRKEGDVAAELSNSDARAFWPATETTRSLETIPRNGQRHPGQRKFRRNQTTPAIRPMKSSGSGKKKRKKEKMNKSKTRSLWNRTTPGGRSFTIIRNLASIPIRTRATPLRLRVGLVQKTVRKYISIILLILHLLF